MLLTPCAARIACNTVDEWAMPARGGTDIPTFLRDEGGEFAL